ncbi:PLAT/LH2 domain [Sesbania bispinosa]|nr:PLAT/LH2 domain [Sesbania bispinosa]
MISGVKRNHEQRAKDQRDSGVERKNVLDINTIASGGVGGIIGTGINLIGSTLDGLTAFLGRNVCLNLISATKPHANGKGKVGKDTYLEGIITSLPTLGAGESAFNIHFEWDSDMGIPDVPNHGTIRFVCNSWVYNFKAYKADRIFFANTAYLPSETPAPLVKYREEELKNLRGDGTGERKEYDRIYGMMSTMIWAILIAVKSMFAHSWRV